MRRGRGKPRFVMRRSLIATLALWLAGCFALAFAAPDLLLARVWNMADDPAPYWVSEKLDGVRAYWDGTRLLTRKGHVIAAPDWFVAGFPAQPLDGELWMGRGRFTEVSAAVRRLRPEDAEWRQIQYCVFELPGGEGDFTARMAAMRSLSAAVLWLQPVEQFRVATPAELQVRLDAIVAAGGEGLMLHRADAPYLTGRQAVLFKLKPWFDADARVVGHIPVAGPSQDGDCSPSGGGERMRARGPCNTFGEGRLADQMGAIEVESAEGLRFRIGSGFSDAERRTPPPIGSLITYRYTSLMPGGLPRFPVFLRVRTRD